MTNGIQSSIVQPQTNGPVSTAPRPEIIPSVSMSQADEVPKPQEEPETFDSLDIDQQRFVNDY